MSSTSSRVNPHFNCWESVGRIETHDIKNSMGKISVPHGIFSDPRSISTLCYECENTEKVFAKMHHEPSSISSA